MSKRIGHVGVLTSALNSVSSSFYRVIKKSTNASSALTDTGVGGIIDGARLLKTVTCLTPESLKNESVNETIATVNLWT